MLVAVGVPILVVQHPPAIPRQLDVRVVPTRVVPQAEVPAVEPLKLVDMTREEAEAYNASVPFSTGPNPAARPFKFVGTTEDLARATDCLAAGVLYEAGDDAAGEKAVAQVMLNRLRHPAFAKTVCGVVFAGAERSTGCQFSFTCDGSLDRWHPTADQWTRATRIATDALAGAVYRPVGYSTHYHTSWVVPYWQSSLDKVVAVHDHLFFRWTGWWGTPGAFRRQVETGEPVIAKLAAISPAHGMAWAVLDSDAAQTQAALLLGKPIAPLASDPDAFLTALDPVQPPESYQALALAGCGERIRCRVMGWTDSKAVATTLPLTTQQVAALSFSYTRDRTAGADKVLWNCQQFPRTATAQCMKRQMLVETPVAPPLPVPSPTSTGQPAATSLEGVRRRTDAASTAPPPVVPVPETPRRAKRGVMQP